MTADTTPSVALELPPLPSRDYTVDGPWPSVIDVWDEIAMRAYAQRAVEAATRELRARLEACSLELVNADEEIGRLRVEAQELRDDRDSWMQQASSRTADAVKFGEEAAALRTKRQLAQDGWRAALDEAAKLLEERDAARRGALLNWDSHNIAVTAVEKAHEELVALRAELASVLADWNALVAAIGSPTNGGAVGHAAALRRELEALRVQVPVAWQILWGIGSMSPCWPPYRDKQEAEIAATYLKSATEVRPLYAHPTSSVGPARKGLSPLTPERQHELWRKANSDWLTDEADFKAGIRSAEAAHGIAAPAGTSEGDQLG